MIIIDFGILIFIDFEVGIVVADIVEDSHLADIDLVGIAVLVDTALDIEGIVHIVHIADQM